MKSRNIFAGITVMVMLLAIFVISYDVNDFAPDYDKNDQTDAYMNILESFRKGDKGSENRRSTDGITADGYPEYYAGAHNGSKLLILLADGYNGGSLVEIIRAEKAKAELRELAGTDNILFKEGKHSLRELLYTMEKVYEFVVSDADAPYEICKSELDIINSGVNIGIYPLDENTEEWFRNTIDDVDFVTFTETPPGSIQAT